MSKVKLNQIVALNGPKKADFKKLITNYYHMMQSSGPFFGLERHYIPKDDEGQKLPSESTKVQIKVGDLLDEIRENWINMFDLILTNDVGNCAAKADITIDDVVILKDVPITTLIFLEKQLSDDIKAVLNKVPTLPLSDDWLPVDTDTGLYTTKEIEKVRTAKIEESLVLLAPTKEHPGQAKSVVKDVAVGYWREKKLSSAYPHTKISKLLERLSKLRDAVTLAKEQANSLEISQMKGGKVIMDYLFQ